MFGGPNKPNVVIGSAIMYERDNNAGALDPNFWGQVAEFALWPNLKMGESIMNF